MLVFNVLSQWQCDISWPLLLTPLIMILSKWDKLKTWKFFISFIWILKVWKCTNISWCTNNKLSLKASKYNPIQQFRLYFLWILEQVLIHNYLLFNVVSKIISFELRLGWEFIEIVALKKMYYMILLGPNWVLHITSYYIQKLECVQRTYMKYVSYKMEFILHLVLHQIIWKVWGVFILE